MSLQLLKTFLAVRGIRSLRGWATRARVKPSAIYQARHGRPLSERNLRKLARAVAESEVVVRGLLSP